MHYFELGTSDPFPDDVVTYLINREVEDIKITVSRSWLNNNSVSDVTDLLKFFRDYQEFKLKDFSCEQDLFNRLLTITLRYGTNIRYQFCLNHHH